jgi:transcriptional regulator with XRE-family HTH domain
VLDADLNPWLTDEEISRILGDRIKARRLMRNMTQEELARETGLTKLTIQKIEQGRGSRLETFIRILRVFGDLAHLNHILQTQNISIKEQYENRSRKHRKRARK